MIRIALEYDDDLSLLDNLVVVRRVLEREMARAAAPRLTDDELAALAENIEQMEASYDDYERFRAFDLAFHAIVMQRVRQRGRPDDRPRHPPRTAASRRRSHLLRSSRARSWSEPRRASRDPTRRCAPATASSPAS